MDNDGKTFVKPNPGGRLNPTPPTPQRASPGPSGDAPAAPPMSARQHVNPLLAAASELQYLVGRLRQLRSYDDIAGLRQRGVQAVTEFERRALAAGVAAEQVTTARYLLCAFFDEAVLNTLWGSGGAWAEQPLLAHFHQEAWGGEKFFEVVDALLRAPDTYLDLIELAYVCLMLGFEGKYRLQDKAGLERLKEDLYRLIAGRRAQSGIELSLRWQGEVTEQDRLVDRLPVWVAGSAAAALLLIVFVVLWVRIGGASEAVNQQLAQIGFARLTPASVAYLPSKGPDLEELLTAQVARGELAVETAGGGETRLTVPASNLFASGSAEFQSAYLPLFRAIGEAIEQVDGQVYVVGHTDDVPIRSFRFPNNTALSQARAESVAATLRDSLSDPARVGATGRGAAEPVCSESTSACRERNRRVVIVHRGA